MYFLKIFFVSEVIYDHRSYMHNLISCEIKAHDAGAVLYQLSYIYKANCELVTLYIVIYL